MCPCAPLVISAETHLQSLLCLGPCIYHDFGQYNAFAFQLMRCFRILADAILSIIFVQSAEIRWPDVIGHLYTLGLAMLSEILTEWVATTVSLLDTLRSSIFNSGEPIGHPPHFNIKLQCTHLY